MTTKKYERHGMSCTPTYRSWAHMKSRCYDPGCGSYLRYGAKGIGVCDEWRESFTAFYKEMGPRPTREHSIDRIDNSRGYEPGNCKWSTPYEQSMNRSNSSEFQSRHRYVSWNKRKKMWKASVCLGKGERVYLGYFDSEDEAARVVKEFLLRKTENNIAPGFLECKKIDYDKFNPSYKRKFISAARAVVEMSVLGFPLPDVYFIHYIDQNKDNVSPDNLAILTYKEKGMITTLINELIVKLPDNGTTKQKVAWQGIREELTNVLRTLSKANEMKLRFVHLMDKTDFVDKFRTIGHRSTISIGFLNTRNMLVDWEYDSQNVGENV